MSNQYFEPELFGKVLAVVMVLVLVGFGVAYAIHDELLVRDIIGSFISGTLLAYLVHLWLLPD